MLLVSAIFGELLHFVQMMDRPVHCLEIDDILVVTRRLYNYKELVNSLPQSLLTQNLKFRGHMQWHFNNIHNKNSAVV